MFRAEAGRAVEVGVRPEDLVMSAGDAPRSLAFAPEFVEELGPNRLVHGIVGTAPVVVSLAASAEMTKAASAQLTAAPDRVHLFDVDSGRSLGCAS